MRRSTRLPTKCGATDVAVRRSADQRLRGVRHEQPDAPADDLQCADAFEEAGTAGVGKDGAAEAIDHPLDRQESLIERTAATILVVDGADRIAGDGNRVRKTRRMAPGGRVGDQPLESEAAAAP